MKIALLLAGYGNVARRFVELLQESRAELAALEIEPVIVGIVTRRMGNLLDSAGLDATQIAQHLAKGGACWPASVPSALEWSARLRSQGVETRVLIETTTLDIRSGEPAISHVRAALAAGVHVITANKGPVAFAYRALADEAARGRSDVSLFEGAVMDGVPIFNLVRETMPAVTVRGFRGVVNSTTNYILTAMEQRRAVRRRARAHAGRRHRRGRSVARRRRMGCGGESRGAGERLARRAHDAALGAP